MAMVLFGQNLTAIALAAMAGGVLTSLVVSAAGLAQRDRDLPPDHAIGIGVRASWWHSTPAAARLAGDRPSAGLWNAGSLNGLTWVKPGRRRR